MTAELFLTIAYVGLAFVLKNTLKFDIRRFRLPDVVAFLLLIPPAAALSAFIYCGVLYLGGELSSDKVFVAMVHCWIGDALGIITIIPAVTAVFIYSSPPRGRWSGHTLFTIFIFVLGMWLGFAALVGRRRQIILSVQSAFLAGHLGGDAGRLRGRRARAGDDPADACR